MKPSRELDALVAERVMGWTEIESKGHVFIESQILGVKPGTIASATGYKPKFVVPHYSTDIAAAWDVVGKFDYLYLFRGKSMFDGKYECKLVGVDSFDFCAYGETAPHAICLAALKALEGGSTSKWYAGPDKTGPLE